VTENFDDTPEGQFMLTISAGLAALESRRTAKRVLDGLVQKARSGGTPKRAPLGYLNIRKWEGANDIRYVEVDPERAPYIHSAFTVYATGEYTLNESRRGAIRARSAGPGNQQEPGRQAWPIRPGADPEGPVPRRDRPIPRSRLRRQPPDLYRA